MSRCAACRPSEIPARIGPRLSCNSCRSRRRSSSRAYRARVEALPQVPQQPAGVQRRARVPGDVDQYPAIALGHRPAGAAAADHDLPGRIALIGQRQRAGWAPPGRRTSRRQLTPRARSISMCTYGSRSSTPKSTRPTAVSSSSGAWVYSIRNASAGRDAVQPTIGERCQPGRVRHALGWVQAPGESSRMPRVKWKQNRAQVVRMADIVDPTSPGLHLRRRGGTLHCPKGRPAASGPPYGVHRVRFPDVLRPGR